MIETSAADDRNAVVELLTGLYDRGLTEHLHWSSAVDVTRIALAAIDAVSAERDSQAALARAAAEDYNRARDQLDKVASRPYELAVERYLVDRLTALLRDPPRLSEQDIRARAALAAFPPYGTKTRTQVIDEIAVYIRDGSHIAIAPRIRSEERSDDPSKASRITEEN